MRGGVLSYKSYVRYMVNVWNGIPKDKISAPGMKRRHGGGGQVQMPMSRAWCYVAKPAKLLAFLHISGATVTMPTGWFGRRGVPTTWYMAAISESGTRYVGYQLAYGCSAVLYPGESTDEVRFRPVAAGHGRPH
jgi:hypothetical protein